MCWLTYMPSLLLQQTDPYIVVDVDCMQNYLDVCPVALSKH